MSGVLRVYDPVECDEHGVPLDWERCRTCVGVGAYLDIDLKRQDCPRCDGHGSLKAAALDALTRPILAQRIGESLAEHAARQAIRCEGCGHPMSDGTWTADGPHAHALACAEETLRLGGEPLNPTDVHYSPCDEGCRHGGPIRSRIDGGRWLVTPNIAVTREGEQVPVSVAIAGGLEGEASWRPVDVRTLGWAHDLRPERLAVLCLRCWAQRTSEARPA